MPPGWGGPYHSLRGTGCDYGGTVVKPSTTPKEETMHQLKPLIAGLGTIVLIACQTTPPRPATISSSTEIVPPTSSVPSEYAAFSGIWAGAWDGMLDSKLAVQRVEEDGEVSTVYAWGDHPQGRFSAGTDSRKGQIENNVLVLDRFGNGAVAKFEMREDGTLDATYNLDGNISEGIFTKQQ